MYYQVPTISPGIQGNPVEKVHLIPKVDVVESLDEVIYIFEMPGVEEKSVNVEVKDNMLFVGGDIVVGVENEVFNILYTERENVKTYSRFLTLPLDVDTEHAGANVKNGLLTIRFPKKKIGRRLPINQQQPQHFQQQTTQNFQPIQTGYPQDPYNPQHPYNQTQKVQGE